MSNLKRLEELLVNGSISRREFLERISAIGLAAALSPMLFNSPVRAAVPKKGGRLRLGLNGGATSDTLDPGIQLAMMPQTLVYGTLGNSLVEIDADGQPVPELDHSQHIPPIKTPIEGLYFASMSQVYPWDRGTNFAVEIGRRAANMIMDS